MVYLLVYNVNRCKLFGRTLIEYTIYTINTTMQHSNIKRQNKYNKMIKLSKNNVDKTGIITYNKDTLKNGHQTDATRINRSRSGTRKLVKSKSCFPEVQGRRRFRWIQLKNSFIVAAYMIGKLFPHGMPYRYNLKQVPTRMPVRHRLKYRDVGIRLPVMFC